MAHNYSIGELLACIIARELKDDDRVAFGLNAELMLAASYLAQKVYSPLLKIRHGLNVNRGTELNPSAWTGNTKSISHQLIEYTEEHESILSMANTTNANKLCDTFLISGIQIDKYGNTNLIGIKGKTKNFMVRGPGSIGTSSIAQFAKKYFIFTLEHSKRRLVEKVDYISSIGYNARKKYGISGGPLLCITPLCVFDFQDGMMGIKLIHPHSNIHEVLEKTGFKPKIPAKVQLTQEPTEKELNILRKIDKNGFLKNIDKEMVI
jgi:glutaconate CoA-transferase, subunit B